MPPKDTKLSPINIVGNRMESGNKTRQNIKELNIANIQYSFRRARPENEAYFLKQSNQYFIFVSFLPLLCSPPKSRACPCSVSPLGGQTRITGKIKASLRVSMEAVRMALLETRREAKRCSVFLCKMSSNLKLLTFPSTIALQLCKLLW